MTKPLNSILETIGNTPVIRINKLAPENVNVFVKAEAFNPTSSVKDRMALSTIEAAEASGANSGKNEELAKKTAKAGAVGGATGAVVGSLSSSSDLGRGAAIGSAGAATATLVSGAFDASEPTQVYIRFVEICLRDKGYQTIGWR